MKNKLKYWRKILTGLSCVLSILNISILWWHLYGHEKMISGHEEYDFSESAPFEGVISQYSDNNLVREMNWAQASEENIKFYDFLNLDGIGSNDDELYISLYRWCDSDTAVIVFQVKLGTGEIIADVIPDDGYFDLYFGRIFSSEKDAVIIQVGVPRSNYGASKLYVYDIFGKNSIDPFPSIVEKINCAGDDDFTPTIDASIPRDDLVMGTELIDLDDSSLQGIKLQFDNDNERWNNYEKVIYWTGNGWKTMR